MTIIERLEGNTMTERELQRRIVAQFRSRRPPLDPALFSVPPRGDEDAAQRRETVDRFLTDWRGQSPDARSGRVPRRTNDNVM